MSQIEAGNGITCSKSQTAAAQGIRRDSNAQYPAVLARPAAVLGIADPAVAQRLATDVARWAIAPAVSVASSLARLCELSQRTLPQVIALEIELLQGQPLLESMRPLIATAPLIVVGAAEHQEELADLVAAGNLDFVVRVGEFIPLVAALIVRRWRCWVRMRESAVAPAWAGPPAGISEIFRHEINNPLTGILGNSELVLAHREHLSGVQIQRLQTVVDLAVRLRETIRRLSDAWERPQAPQAP
ncbi:MAG TPA: histidine kinase dimerization/phospho-acceptor domain-containing protein [Candidatus Acidoferrales bacterium]|nr:histidine kinase dimerization/phospho-acceptor domain-containing protein [Candidatus Acidoferrales bacterium]